MADHELQEYLRQTTQLIQDEYVRIQKRVGEDPGTAGDNGEENWRLVLREWLPPSYPVVTKGRILTADGWCSRQMDVLVLSPSYPPRLIGKKEYLAGGVVAAFECKLTLESGHLPKVVETAVELSRHSPPNLKGTPRRELARGILYGLLAHSHEWNRPASTPAENLERGLRSAFEAKVEHPREFLDLVCVADLGFWSMQKMVMSRRMVHANAEILKQAFDGQDVTGGFVGTGLIRYSQIQPTPGSTVVPSTPIGALIAEVLDQLAWDDASVRSIAQYFVHAGASGQGHGVMRTWPAAEVLSESAQRGPMVRGPSESAKWNDWGPLV